MDWLQPVMFLMIIVMVVMMAVKMVKEIVSKGKKKLIEIPRDPNERLEKAYKLAVKGGLNKDRMRHTLWCSGDKIIQGYRVGDIVGIQPQNEMYKMHVKPHWWMFWKKAIPIYVDPILCSDLNCKDVVVQCRGFEALTDGLIYPIPISGTENLEAIYVGRDNWRLARVLKQSADDVNTDTDILLKMAMRGDLARAGSEIGRPEIIPEIDEELVRRQQAKRYRQLIEQEGGGD